MGREKTRGLTEQALSLTITWGVKRPFYTLSYFWKKNERLLVLGDSRVSHEKQYRSDTISIIQFMN
jgi:hypothetical protein